MQTIILIIINKRNFDQLFELFPTRSMSSDSGDKRCHLNVWFFLVLVFFGAAAQQRLCRVLSTGASSVQSLEQFLFNCPRFFPA